MGYSLAGWVGLLHSVLHGLACLSGSWAVGMLLGVGWGWFPPAFLRYVEWGGVFSVSWYSVAEAGMVGHYKDTPPAFLRYVEWGGVFSVSWYSVAEAGMVGHYKDTLWVGLLGSVRGISVLVLDVRAALSICLSTQSSSNLWLSDVPSVLWFSSGSLRFWSIFFSV